MRHSISFVGLAAALTFVTLGSGCSAPTDGTQNQVDDPVAGDYPTGPYGYVESATVANYKFLGKTPSGGTYGDAIQPIFLDDFHDDPAAKLLLIVGSAGWCYFCNEEAPLIEALATEKAAEGFRAFTVLAEGNVRGVPSTADDITNWVTKHDFRNNVMGIDPESRLFQYAPASAFPLHILLNAKTMSIVWLCVGGSGGCDTEAAVTDALGSL